MNNKHFLPLFLACVVFAITSVFAQKPRPAWVDQQPVDSRYYIGIGYASKVENPHDYARIARDNALANMASQIKVKITSDVMQKVMEKAGVLEEEFKSYVRSSTQAELEGFELVDSWENDREYWVYYRLSIEKYQRLRKARLSKATSLALDMFKRARQHERNGDVAKALLFYFQSIPPIEKFLAEPLLVKVDGQQLYLFNEIYASLQRILSQIKLTAVQSDFNGKLGKPLSAPLQARADFKGHPIQNLPILFEFTRGSGELIPHAFTDASGIARTQVLRITSIENLQIVTAQIDLQRTVNQEHPSIVLKGVMNSLAAPTTRFTLHVKGLTAFIESKEVNLGKPVEIKQLEPALKRILTDQGFSFTASPASADYIIKIDATARKGAEVYGLFSSFVNLTLSVVDTKSGREIYKNVLENVKGIDLNYEKAGIKALSNAAKEINAKLIPDFLRKIKE